MRRRSGSGEQLSFTHPIGEFYQSRGTSVYRDSVARRAYDRETATVLDAYAPDLVILDGYCYLLTTPMLEAFPRRILNLHFSDLTIRRADRRPAYAGIRAVRDAIVDGQTETSATVHMVNEEPDGGPPVVRSWPYPVSPLVAHARSWDAGDMLKVYAFAHQEWMIRGASAPLLSAALQLVASGTVDLDELATRDPGTVTPWLIDERGRMIPPAGTRIQRTVGKSGVSLNGAGFSVRRARSLYAGGSSDPPETSGLKDPTLM